MTKIVFTLAVLSGISIAGGVIDAMKDACERNVAEACYELGSLYQGNDGIAKDEEKVDKYLAKACDLNYERACTKFKKINIKQAGNNNE